MRLIIITTNDHLRKDDLIKMLDEASMMMSDVPALKPGETMSHIIEFRDADYDVIVAGTLMVEG